jgi:hypothetical protein
MDFAIAKGCNFILVNPECGLVNNSGSKTMAICLLSGDDLYPMNVVLDILINDKADGRL